MPALLAWRARTASTQPRAREDTRAEASADNAANGMSCATDSASSARNAARIASAAGCSGSMGIARVTGCLSGAIGLPTQA